MKKLEIKEVMEMKNCELVQISGGNDFLRDGFKKLGALFGKLCSWASFEDSNSINEGYVGRGR